MKYTIIKVVQSPHRTNKRYYCIKRAPSRSSSTKYTCMHECLSTGQHVQTMHVLSSKLGIVCISEQGSTNPSGPSDGATKPTSSASDQNGRSICSSITPQARGFRERWEQIRRLCWRVKLTNTFFSKATR